VRATQPELTILAGTEASTSFLFFPRQRLSLAGAVTRGEPRYVRSVRPRCRFFPLAWVCPTAIPKRARHLRRLAPPQHSDDRRARVEGPSEGRVSRNARAMISRLAPGAYALIFTIAHAKRRSPPRRPPDILLSPVRPMREEEPLSPWRTDLGLLSDAAPRRETPSRRPGCLPPSRPRRGKMRSLPPALRAGPSLTPPTLFPQGGDSVFDGHCERHGAVTRGP